MHFGLITTLNTNIGDDFIREGLCNVLREIYPPDSLRFTPVNKHKPLTVYPSWHPALAFKKPPFTRGRGRVVLGQKLGALSRSLGMTRFDGCDAIIQCGAPVFWDNCGKNTEWRKELWEEVVGRLYTKMPVLNLAAGSCFAYENQPAAFRTPEDREYVQWLNRICRATAVRDRLSLALLTEAGCKAELIPCSALLFTNPSQAQPDPKGPVLINYMSGGGHYNLGQNIDPKDWEQTVKELIRRLKLRHEVVMLCHDQKEVNLAKALAPDCAHALPTTYADFPKVVSRAKAALCNRMHASVAMAGMGIPSIAVCTDTRLLMVERIGLPAHYVKDTSADQLEAEIEGLITKRAEEAARLRALQLETKERYAALMRKHLPA